MTARDEISWICNVQESITGWVSVGIAVATVVADYVESSSSSSGAAKGPTDVSGKAQNPIAGTANSFFPQGVPDNFNLQDFVNAGGDSAQGIANLRSVDNIRSDVPIDADRAYLLETGNVPSGFLASIQNPATAATAPTPPTGPLSPGAGVGGGASGGAAGTLPTFENARGSSDLTSATSVANTLGLPSSAPPPRIASVQNTKRGLTNPGKTSAPSNNLFDPNAG